MRPILSLTIAFVLGAITPTAYAQLYKWIDDSGVVNYGDWPPSGVKVQPVTHGTLSSVAARPPAGQFARAADATRSASRAAGPAVTVGYAGAPSDAPASTGDSEVIGAYAPYHGYGRWPADAKGPERRPAIPPVAKPLLPIDPAIPDMPLRPRR